MTWEDFKEKIDMSLDGKNPEIIYIDIPPYYDFNHLEVRIRNHRDTNELGMVIE